MHEGAEAPKKEKKRNRKEMQNDGQGCGFGCVFWWLRRLVWFCSVGRVDCFSWTCTSCDPTVFKLSLNGSWHCECYGVAPMQQCSSAAAACADVQPLTAIRFGCQVGTWQQYKDAGNASANSIPDFDHEVDTVGVLFDWWILGFVGWVVPQLPKLIHYALCFNSCSRALTLWSMAGHPQSSRGRWP